MISTKSAGRGKFVPSGVRSGIALSVNASVLSPGRSGGRNLSDQIVFSSWRISRATCRRILSPKQNLLMKFVRFSAFLNICTVKAAYCIGDFTVGGECGISSE